jgi:DNA polymerase III alpha subunit
MYNVLPLFKSHYSLGKSILTLEKPKKNVTEYPVSVFDLLLHNNFNKLFLVEDNVSGLLQANQVAKDNKIQLHFGLRISITESIENQDDDSLKKRAKYIIFAKNNAGYKDIIKISTIASKQGFYYSPAIDFKTLRKLWTKDLKLCVPFYDSFLYMNSFCSHSHVPQFDFTNPTFFIENNDLPFDYLLKDKVLQYCKEYEYVHIPTQSIFYKSEQDFLAYLTFRCVHGRASYKKATLERPEIEHMGSEEFNFDRWFNLNKI